jgi:hypothetical protein
MGEVYVILAVILCSLLYYLGFKYCSYLKRVKGSITDILKTTNIFERGIGMQWITDVALAGCLYCVSGNLAIISCFVIDAASTLIAVSRVFIIITATSIIQKAYESKRV